MGRAFPTTANSANLRGAVLCTDNAVSCTISELFRSKYPVKTWSFVAEMFGLQERTAKHRLAGSRVYTVGELQALLHSEDGLDFLVAVMGDAKPTWWRWITKVMTLAAVRRRQAEDAQEILKLETSGDADVGARRRIKGALNADKRISAAVARAETTLGLSRPNVDRVGVAAGSRGGRVPHRAVVGAAKRQA
jgi:hypothetical protein